MALDYGGTAKKGWRRCLLKIVVAKTIYHVWEHRNKTVFGGSKPTMDIIDSIKLMVLIRGQQKRKLKEHLDVGNVLIK